jgi:hypothetical protein
VGVWSRLRVGVGAFPRIGSRASEGLGEGLLTTIVRLSTSIATTSIFGSAVTPSAELASLHVTPSPRARPVRAGGDRDKVRNRRRSPRKGKSRDETEADEGGRTDGGDVAGSGGGAAWAWRGRRQKRRERREGVSAGKGEKQREQVRGLRDLAAWEGMSSLLPISTDEMAN